MNGVMSINDFDIGTEMPVLVKKPIGIVQLVRYAGASGDFNPLHIDPQAGKAAGIEQIAHGMLIMGFVGQAITDWVPKKYIRKLSVRFAGMTKPGDTVKVTGRIRAKDAAAKKIECDVTAVNQEDAILIRGYFEAILP